MTMREMGGSALLQKAMDTSSVQALVQSISVVIDAASFSVNDKNKLLALVQNKQGDDDEDKEWGTEKDSMAELGAPDPAVYKSKSGGIVETLTDMKDKAEAQLSEERKAEGTSKHNYELLKLSLEDEIAASKTEMDEAKADKAEAEETKAAADGDLAVTSKDLALATETLKNIGSDCMTKATDHEVSMKGYDEELKALDTAKKIIQESTLLQTTSFLQMTSSSKLRTLADLKNFEVVSVIKRLAT